MTDPAPPSIPPRNRPTAPSSSSAHVVSAPDPRDASGAGTAGPDEASSARAAASGSATTSTQTSAQHDPPTPLMVAVDKTTAWLKKAAGATTSALSPAHRPQNEDPMTSTPTARTSQAGASGATPPSVPPRTSSVGAQGAPTSARPATGRIPTVSAGGGPRRVRLAISRVDPWSVMKLSFLLSVAFGILLVVAIAVVWYTLNRLHVFTSIDDLVKQITGTENSIDILQYVEFKRVISGGTLIAVIDVFLLTALATIGAFLYNIVAALVGGLHVTMTDE